MRQVVSDYLAEQQADKPTPHSMVFVSLLMPVYMRRAIRRLAGDADISRSALIRNMLDHCIRELAAQKDKHSG